MITELPRQQWLEAPGWCGMQTGLCARSRRPPPRGSWTRLAAELPGGPRGVASLPPPQARPGAGYKAGPAWPSAQPAGTLLEPPRGTRLSAPPLLLRPTRGTMRPLWLCWALWALPLPGPGATLSGEQIRGRLLRQLHLSEVPVLDEGDVGELVTPAHVMAQYVALLQRSHGVRSRGKRFSQEFRGEASLPLCPSSLLGLGGRRWDEPEGGRLGAQGPRGRAGGPRRVRTAASGGPISAPSAPPLGQEELSLCQGRSTRARTSGLGSQLCCLPSSPGRVTQHL